LLKAKFISKRSDLVVAF